MTLLFCRILYTVAQQGSFAKAADALNLTPSAVSHSISAMEKELGFLVFNRNKTGVSLTGYGAEIYPYIVELLNREEALNQVVDSLNGMEHGTVRLGSFNSACIHWLPDILQDFRTRHPGIEVEVYQGTYDDVIYWLETGTIEMGFLSTSCNTDFNIKPLYEDPLVCITPKGFRTEQEGFITLEEMQKQPFVIQRESCDADVKKFLNDTKLDIRSSCHVIDDLATAAMVSAGFGIGILPELACRNLPDTLDVLHIRQEKEATRTIGLAVPDKKHMTPAAAQLRREILERFQNLGALS